MKSNLNILIADDHILFRRGLESILTQNENIDNIFHASSNDEILKVIQLHSVDIIFMDIRMPGGDGFQSTRDVLSKFKDIKIIALSMLDDRTSIINMFKSGAVGYITKCANADEINKSIFEVMNGGKYISNELPSLLDEEIKFLSNEKKSSPNHNFTKRELDVMKLICQGYTNKESATILNISIKAIEAYKSRLFDKTGARNSTGLVSFAFENNYYINKI